MNKVDLIEAISEKIGGLSKANIAHVLDTAGELMLAELKSGEKISIFGLGKLDVVVRAERVGRNPRTGESIKIPSRKSVKFSAGKSLKEALNP